MGECPERQRGRTVNPLAMPSQVRVLPPPPAFARFASYSSASHRTAAALKPIKRVYARRSLSSGRPELVIGPRSARTRWAGPVGRAMGRRRASPTSRLYPESGCDLHHSTLSRGGSDCREVPWGPQNPSRRRFLRGSLSTTGSGPFYLRRLIWTDPLAANQNIAVSCQHSGVAQHSSLGGPNNFRQPRASRHCFNKGKIAALKLDAAAKVCFATFANFVTPITVRMANLVTAITARIWESNKLTDTHSKDWRGPCQIGKHENTRGKFCSRSPSVLFLCTWQT